MNRIITDAEAAEALAAEWPEQRPVSLPERLDDEADLCANEGADDIAELLAEAATELRALAGRVRELEAERDAAAEVACGAVRKAFSLGQTYWQQADSEYTSQHRKAEGTWATFKALIEETRAALNAQKGGV